MPRTTSTSAPGMRSLILARMTRSPSERAATTTVAPFGVAEMADDVDCFADGPILVAGDAEHLAAVQDQHDRYSGDVADQDRLREVVSDPAEANETSHEEHETHQEGEHGCQRGIFRAPAGGERSERRRDQQRHSAFRPYDDPRR